MPKGTGENPDGTVRGMYHLADGRLLNGVGQVGPAGDVLAGLRRVVDVVHRVEPAGCKLLADLLQDLVELVLIDPSRRRRRKLRHSRQGPEGCEGKEQTGNRYVLHAITALLGSSS